MLSNSPCLYFFINPVCPCTQRAVAALDTGKTTAQIQKHGHKGILTLDEDSKLENVTTFKAVYIPPRSPGVRLRGMYFYLSTATVIYISKWMELIAADITMF